jgi:hypothetical protein
MNGIGKDIIVGLVVGVGVIWFWGIMTGDEYA